MSNEKNLESRIKNLETKIDNLVEVLNTKQRKIISREKFTNFYNTTKFDLPAKTGCIPVWIWVNETYSDNMKENLLYPSENEGIWHLTGELNPLPISFKEMASDIDYYVDMRAAGNFW